jgi:hypothetical protein
MKARVVGRAFMRRFRREVGYHSRDPLRRHRTPSAILSEQWSALSAWVYGRCGEVLSAIEALR